MRLQKKLVSELLTAGKAYGLYEVDVRNTQDMLEHLEYGLAFDIIITQLYEHKIKIDKEFYSLIEYTAKTLHLPEDEYSCMKELIAENVAPMPVREKIIRTLEKLKS